MSRQEYIDAVARIQATESFKRDTIEKMRKEASEMLKNKDIRMDKTDNIEEHDTDHTIRRRRIGSWAFAAVFLVLVVAIAAILPNVLIPPVSTSGDLPLLEIDKAYFERFDEPLQGTGPEVLESNNPWTEGAELDTLPVVKKADAPETFNKEQRIEKAKEVAKALGVENVEITDNMVEDQDTLPKTGAESTKVYFGTEAFVQVDCYGNFISMGFVPVVSLPEELHYDPHHLSKEEGSKILDYFLDQNSGLFELKSPVPNVTEYSDPNTLSYKTVAAYEGAETLADQMLNWYNTQAIFGLTENKLNSIYYTRLQTEKIGDYPIITAEKAREIYKKGASINNAAYEDVDLSGKEIVKTDLMYMGDSAAAEQVPIYRIYVEGEPTEDGLKQYYQFFVPAIKGEYISNMPTAG